MTDEEFSTCMWTHEIEDQYVSKSISKWTFLFSKLIQDSNGQQMMFECSTSGGQHSSQCENNGGSDELDSEASRYVLW